MEGMWNGAGQRVRPSIFRVRFRALRAYVVPKIMWKTHDFSPPEKLFGGGRGGGEIDYMNEHL